MRASALLRVCGFRWKRNPRWLDIQHVLDGTWHPSIATVGRCDVISTEADGEDIVVRWRLSGRINLPFNPPIKPYVVTTTFERDSGTLGKAPVWFGVVGNDMRHTWLHVREREREGKRYIQELRFCILVCRRRTRLRVTE